MREEGKVLHHSGMKNWISGGQTGMDAVSMAIATHSSDAAASEIIKEMCGLVQQPSFTSPYSLILLRRPPRRLLSADRFSQTCREFDPISDFIAANKKRRRRPETEGLHSSPECFSRETLQILNSFRFAGG